jgi:hypothetical protein
MQNRFTHLQFLYVTLLVVLLSPLSARADGLEIKPEVWLGGGVSWPDYHAHSEACARGGVGAVFAKYVTLGISGQADRDFFHIFADAGLIGPQVSFFVPYGRYQFGRRTDRDDDAWGWCAGIRMKGEGVDLYLEASEILEPEFNKALTFGIYF